MPIKLMIVSILCVSCICVIAMFRKLPTQPKITRSIQENVKLAMTGVLAFIADTLGVGSFPITIALSKLWGTFEDHELPAVTNGAQVIPGTIEALFFIQIIHVDLTTLLTLVAGTCVGGILGGHMITHLSKQKLRLAMIICFTGIIGLLIYQKFGYFTSNHELTALHAWKLWLGFLAMSICGALTSVGIGLFAMVQAVLFLMHLSPAVAFPIMTVAGAMQQPLTTLVFLKQDKIPLRKTLTLSLFGCLGVLIALPIVTHMKQTWLHSLLLIIMIYNVFSITSTYFNDKKSLKASVVLN
ncbi:MAG: anion permease [Legionella sp.]|nr:anion permease [Legionella sp.]